VETSPLGNSLSVARASIHPVRLLPAILYHPVRQSGFEWPLPCFALDPFVDADLYFAAAGVNV